jgi:competence CoiA-like predicted nuclease
MSVGQAQCPYHASQLSTELSMSVGQAQCPYHATQPKISSSTSPRLLTSFRRTNHTSKQSNMKFQSSLYKHMKVLVNQHGLQVNLEKHILWLSCLGFIA